MGEIRIELEREEDGRWIAEITAVPGVMAYAEARVCIEQWRREYNEVRPHSSIAYLTPAAFVRQNPSTPNPGRGEAALY